MQVVHSVDECPELGGSVVTIGAYDGVHLGHRAVIGQVRDLAAARGLATVVVTFDRHPAAVVRPESAPLLLTDLDQKLELLQGTGVDVAMVVHFDEVRAKEPAEEFVDELLVGCLRARVVVVGDDFHFGHRRRGNVELLRELGPRQGFEVAPVHLVGLDGSAAPAGEPKVSSTAIRAALRSGDLAGANAMLGRAHEVRGVVGHGDQRARQLGFRTANVEVPDEVCLPSDGIYAAWYLRPGGAPRPAAVSLGRRPTFYDDQPYSLLEAHLLDVDDPDGLDLYGEQARVRFVRRLRDEERFDSVDALVAQMGRDCDRARHVLADA
jgi:riboflavin kinase/FMN adenylyltransferase